MILTTFLVCTKEMRFTPKIIFKKGKIYDIWICFLFLLSLLILTGGDKFYIFYPDHSLRNPWIMKVYIKNKLLKI